MANAVSLYRIMRWCYLHHIPLLPKLIQLFIFLFYNTKITGDSSIGKGTYFVCKGIATVLIPGTQIGNNCVLGLRFSTVRKFPYKDVPVIAGNSLVDKSIPKGAIVGGCPAKIIGWRSNLEYDIETNPKFKEGTMPYMTEKKKG